MNDFLLQKIGNLLFSQMKFLVWLKIYLYCYGELQIMGGHNLLHIQRVLCIHFDLLGMWILLFAQVSLYNVFVSLIDNIIERLFCILWGVLSSILWELFWENWRKGSRERFMWKRVELEHKGISCCNSWREYGVDDDKVRRGP